jgi:hypothetical protein
MSCDDVSKGRGVYLVVRESNRPVCFLETSSGGHFKGRNPSVPVSVLRSRWLDPPKVVYIGKAGGTTVSTTIQVRLRSFMQFGSGHRCAHWGGRYIWQLCDAADLLVYWKSTPCKDPRQVERTLLQEFVQKYGQLPFANLRR